MQMRQQLCKFIVTNESVSTTVLVCESNMAAFLLLGDICHVGQHGGRDDMQ